MYTTPTVSDFKSYFVRDFPYGTDISTSVTDQDIQRALDQASVNFNYRLFSSQMDYSTGYLLLAAHYLVMNIRGSSGGLNGSFSFPEASKSVGSVSTSYSIPEWVNQSATWGWLSRTYYGMSYLMMIKPRMVGNIFTVIGSTRP